MENTIGELMTPVTATLPHRHTVAEALAITLRFRGSKPSAVGYTETQRISLTRTLTTLTLATLLAACAGPGPKPNSELQSAESAIKQAEAADARRFEPVLLNEAKNKVADARGLMDKERYKEARRLLEQAEVDAQLAGARSETEKAQQAVAEINSNIENLRKQINSNQQ